MKNSEILKQQSAEEDNDLIAMGLHAKIIREERNERFEDKWLPKLKDKFGDYIKYDEKLFAWRIKHGPDELAYYPKANKIFDYSSNTWIKQGLKYLIKKFKLA